MARLPTCDGSMQSLHSRAFSKEERVEKQDASGTGMDRRAFRLLPNVQKTSNSVEDACASHSDVDPNAGGLRADGDACGGEASRRGQGGVLCACDEIHRSGGRGSDAESGGRRRSSKAFRKRSGTLDAKERGSADRDWGMLTLRRDDDDPYSPPSSPCSPCSPFSVTRKPSRFASSRTGAGARAAKFAAKKMMEYRSFPSYGKVQCGTLPSNSTHLPRVGSTRSG